MMKCVKMNQWITSPLEEFQSMPISYVKPNQKRGTAALQLLLNYQLPLSPTPWPDSTIFVGFGEAITEKMSTMKAFMLELKSSEGWQGVNHFTKEEDWEVEGKKVSVFLEQMSKHHWQEGNHFLSILNLLIPNVIQHCKPGHPGSLDPDLPTNFHFSMEEGCYTTWFGVIVPLSAITFCHLDEKKLWLAWPLMKNNLWVYAFWLKMHSSSLPIKIAISRLEGLEVLLVDIKQVAWSLPPMMLHAVITFSWMAAHMSSYYVSVDGFKTSKLTISISLECLGGDKMVASEGSVQELGHQEALRALDDLHISNLACWECLAEKMEGHEFGSGKEIHHWVQEVKEKALPLTKVRRELEEEAKVEQALLPEEDISIFFISSPYWPLNQTCLVFRRKNVKMSNSKSPRVIKTPSTKEGCTATTACPSFPLVDKLSLYIL
ncbi:hypothetical protein CPB84DRAFT_1747012 [Gymnopilus junonius]|uniref:Uncharacterized protein n=1 Tax=Gymnopilus junonius TaxID=109634 RepID=A0A9P5NNQ7_GYMJU|nr:hypothetical protein CPB84DRAFT_1747012 [Gymnopilus junonius]